MSRAKRFLGHFPQPHPGSRLSDKNKGGGHDFARRLEIQVAI